MGDPEAVVSPGGVGFDINCGVRVLRTNLMEADVAPVRQELTQSLFDHIPVGVGSQGVIPTTMNDLEEALEMGNLQTGKISVVQILQFTPVFNQALDSLNRWTNSVTVLLSIYDTCIYSPE